MPDLTLIAYLIGGLILLAVAGDFLVNGAASLARRAGVSPLVAGIFVVGFGTSAPEMIVAFDAARSGYPELALGNIVGSNIANIWLVVALPAILATLQTGGHGEGNAAFSMLLATAAWIIALSLPGLTPVIGIAFLVGLMVYAILTFYSMRRAHVELEDDDPPRSLPVAIVFVLIGFVGLPVGAHMIVEGGVGVAETLGVSQEIIGLTLLAIGTSLPEIGAGVASALRGRTDILVGNVLGSNIFNIMGAGGLIAFFGPIKGAPTFNQYDHWAMAFAALMLAFLIFIGAKVSRLAGIAMLLLYAIYIYGLVNGWNILRLFGVVGA